MQRRLAVLTTAAAVMAGAGSLLGAANAGAPLPAGYPAAGCFTYADPTGDAVLGVLADSDLDLTGFSLETTSTSLKAYARVPQLTNDQASLAPFDGHRFTLKFTFNKHVFSASGSDYASGSGDSGSGALRDGLAQTGHAGHVTQLGVDTPPINPTSPDPAILSSPGYVDSGLKVTFDYKNGWVLWDLPIADIEKYGAAKFTGDITALSIAGQTDEYAVGSVWDTAPDNDANGIAVGKWTVGDNKCFGPPAAILRNIGATTVPYGDTATVSTKVTSASGAPISGAEVRFALGRLLTSARTNANGIATAKLTPKGTAGSYSLVESYDGSGTVGKASLTTAFKIVPEKSVLRLTTTSQSGKRIVTATLRDDEGHALAEQAIAWFINGKAAGRSTTSSTGTTKLTAKPGRTIKVVYSGVTGKYAGDTASRKV